MSKKRKSFLRRRVPAKPDPKEAEVVTVQDMEDMAKGMFDEADRKAGLDKKPGWKTPPCLTFYIIPFARVLYRTMGQHETERYWESHRFIPSRPDPLWRSIGAYVQEVLRCKREDREDWRKRCDMV